MIKDKVKKISPLTVGIIALLCLAAIFLLVGKSRSMQAESATAAGVIFLGEYKVGDGEYTPITEGEHISATKGDVTLRGSFRRTNPTTGELLEAKGATLPVALYFDHVGGKIHFPAGFSVPFDAEFERYGEDACAIFWRVMQLPEGEELTIELHNPHLFGNENAVDEFLGNMALAIGSNYENTLMEKGSGERSMGFLVLVFAFIVLGIAVFATVIHLKYRRIMWLIGLTVLFAGLHFLFDAFGVSIWNDSNIINTRVLGLTLMFYMLFGTAVIATALKGLWGRIARGAVWASGASVVLCILVSFVGSIKFFDVQIYWMFFEILVLLVLIACCAMSIRRASLRGVLSLIGGILALATFPLDVLAMSLGWWSGAIVTKYAFILIWLAALVTVLRIIPAHINAAIRARQLEAEQQALKLELQENRISIMLSQMRPHFIFNTLNTIYHLCEIDPDKARSTISSFSEYLRNNIDTLGQSEMIFFEKELSFVKTYLDIEKVRFDDELEITLDIAVTDFKLPVLTVQPLVENAVKHGTSKKEGVASLLLSTRETEEHYVITISDTGVGFDPTALQTDGHKHIGIDSARERLENLCGGSLTIESERGVGTTVTVRIPKGGKEQL